MPRCEQCPEDDCCAACFFKEIKEPSEKACLGMWQRVRGHIPGRTYQSDREGIIQDFVDEYPQYNERQLELEWKAFLLMQFAQTGFQPVNRKKERRLHKRK